MNAEDARLEALKLAHRGDLEIAQVLEKAKAYAEFLVPSDGTLRLKQKPGPLNRAG